MDPQRYSTLHFFEHNLTLATSDNPCSEQLTPSDTKNYTDYIKTATHGVGGITAKLDFYAPKGMPDHSCCDVPPFASLNCLSIPGKPSSLTIFGTGPYCCPKGATEHNPCPAKNIEAEAKDDCVTYHKIADGSCGDLCLKSKVGICPRSIITKTGGLEEGSCKDAGYTVDEGEKDQQAGPCGILEIEKWDKAKAILV
jgi:hypothetical protein